MSPIAEFVRAARLELSQTKSSTNFTPSSFSGGRIESFCDLPAATQERLRPLALAYLRG